MLAAEQSKEDTGRVVYSGPANAAVEFLKKEFVGDVLAEQANCDRIPTLWFDRAKVKAVLNCLRENSFAGSRFEMLFDLTAIDERARVHRDGQPSSEFTVMYHLMSFSGNCDIRIKVPLFDADLVLPTVSDLWSNANWYEREAFDMYGIQFNDHPDLRRILTDYGFEGHPLRKDFPLSGNVEVRYNEIEKKIVYEPVKLQQDYRHFDIQSPWEGTTYINDEEKDGNG